MKHDGTYERRVPAEGEPQVRSQQRFLDLARERARASRLSIPTSPFRLVAIADRSEEHGTGESNAPTPSDAARRKRRRARGG
jgi:hypothetical protein